MYRTLGFISIPGDGISYIEGPIITTGPALVEVEVEVEHHYNEQDYWRES